MTSIILWFATFAVAIMASVFVWQQVRQIMSAVRWAYGNRNYTMAFWGSFAIIVLLFCLFVFGLAMVDLYDGKIDAGFIK